MRPLVRSGTFYTGWPTLSGMEGVEVVRIGVASEEIDAVRSLDESVVQGFTDRLGFARLIAENLFNFISSFAVQSDDGERLLLPGDVLDRWFTRFEEKWRADPDFLFRGRG